ncbi:hypothetical protein KKB84_05765 [bacterium]|nr:hypothetical protein [bacterium]MBU1153453.1 hypothetical protein [bacterium]MBU1781834.1 hypothetical protein [bacterium]MBU2599693.1 hypothetical protein [bacterium]
MNYYEVIPILISTVAIICASILVVISYLRTKKFKKTREEDGKTILSLIKEKDGIKDSIIDKLDSLKKEEVTQQTLLLEMVEKYYKKSDEEKKEDLMNWLNYKASTWQKQIESQVLSRMDKLQSEITELSKRLFKIEIRLEKEKK